jgi:hypothetical protein
MPKQKELSKVTIYFAGLFPGKMKPLPEEFGILLRALQKELKLPIWMLLQGDESEEYSELNKAIWSVFLSGEDKLPSKKPIALIIDSPGGSAKIAFQIGRLFQKRCGNFIAIVPRYAKSAATLLALGANEIYMGKHAELGPLDAQTYDPEREHITSALDTVHSLARLRAFALESIDEAMFLMVGRTGKKSQTILPHTLNFVAELMRPLFEQVDIIEYTQMSRVLKVAEEYARRLLLDWTSPDNASMIARHLVEHYPEHGFFIAPEEVKDIGLCVKENNTEVDKILDSLYHVLAKNEISAFGPLEEKQADENK